MEKQKELEERIEILEKVIAVLIVDRTEGINKRGQSATLEELIASATPNGSDFKAKLKIFEGFESKEILKKYATEIISIINNLQP